MPKKSSNPYTQNGLSVSPITFAVGDKVKLTYNGTLTSNSTPEIYAHIGYGTATWKDIADIKMSKTTTGYRATISVDKASQLNVCFKDSWNNWDNNNGQNYTFTVEKE